MFHTYKVMPNILKIDVHGAEGLVLNGAKNILENSVEYILLEVHQQQLLDLFSNGIKKNEILDQLNQEDLIIILYLHSDIILKILIIKNIR